MATAHPSSMGPGLRRNMVTICSMTATIMQALDTTIANVALPYMQGTLSASQDQINWVLTSYIVAAPIMGPSLGAWLTETYSWHWVFLVNLPFGIFTVLGLVIFMDETRKDQALRFDWFGFAALAVAIGSLQLALDRGEQLGWLESSEILAEVI